MIMSSYNFIRWCKEENLIKIKIFFLFLPDVNKFECLLNVFLLSSLSLDFETVPVSIQPKQKCLLKNFLANNYKNLFSSAYFPVWSAEKLFTAKVSREDLISTSSTKIHAPRKLRARAADRFLEGSVTVQ